MFKLTMKGYINNFQIKFDNGYSISLCIGECAHDDSVTKELEHDNVEITSSCIECAVLDKEGDFVVTPWSSEEDPVIWNLSPNELLNVIDWTAEKDYEK